jgi:hypothetical protein
VIAGDSPELKRAQGELVLVFLLLGSALACAAFALRYVNEARRQPKGARAYAEGLEGRASELSEALEASRARVNGLLDDRKDLRGALSERAELQRRAELAAHDAQVREQVAISAAIGGPLDPWAPPEPAAAGENGQPPERSPEPKPEHEQRD